MLQTTQTNSALMLATGWIVLGFLTLVGATVIYLIWTGRIDLSRLISEPTGDASMSRFQLLIFTFVIAASLFLIIAAPNPPVFPKEIPPGVFILLGISASSYLVSKGIQFSSDQGIEDRPPLVKVSPANAVTSVGGAAVQFSASVDRTSNQDVIWSVDPPGLGSIGKTSGVYTPPQTAPQAVPAGEAPILVTIRATSVVDATSSQTATVTVNRGA